MTDDWQPDPQIDAVVRKELDRLKTVIEFEKNAAADRGEKYQQWTKRIEAVPYPLGCARLRLDWALSDTISREQSDDQILDMMFEFVRLDICDLLENGDTDNYADPLLVNMNGKKKRGQELVSISIPSVALYKERIERKDKVEYTFYLLLTAEWA